MKFEEIGFMKVQDDEHGVRYERMDECHDYVQVLFIGYKADGKHIVQSYDKDLMDQEMIGNTCVGLTCYEMKLALRKMRQKGWKSR
jgi:hypothetical protein